MTGKKEEHSIECLLEDLKTRIKLDLEDKDEADPRIADVYKDLARRNKIEEDRTPTAHLQDTIGYVMDIPTPALSNPTHSESQSISSLCDSHLCPSCESAAYDTDSSGSAKHSTIKARRCNASANNAVNLPMSMQIHQANRRMRNSSVDAGTSVCKNTSPPGGGGQSSSNNSIARRNDNRDTASETTSGVSSQDLKASKGGTTSDSETQTELDVDGQPSSRSGDEDQNQTIFYLDKYTHLTKRKRNRGIPNVCTWFGMGAVEHLIQNSVTCNSWVWSSPEAAKLRSCSSKNGSTTTIAASAPLLTPPTSSSELKRSSPHRMLPEIDEWESEKNFFEVLSDVGENILDNISPVSSRRSSRRSSGAFTPEMNHKDNKKKKGNRLLVPGLGGKSLGGLKNSIITRVRSPNRARKTVTNNNKQKSPKINVDPSAIVELNGALQSAMSTLSSSSNNSKSKDDCSTEKPTDDTFLIKADPKKPKSNESKSNDQANKANGKSLANSKKDEAMKNAQLTELLNDEMGDNDFEEKKKAKKRGGGGGGRSFRGGGTMMKCAMFDEFVDYSKKQQPELVSDSKRRSSGPEAGPPSRVEGCVQVRDADKSISR